MLQSDPRLALFALRYTLVLNDPLELSSEVAIRSPAEISGLVAPCAAKQEAVLAGLRGMIADGRLGEWLRALEVGGWDRVVASMKEARRAFPEEKDLPVYWVLWHETPDMGFPVDGGWVNNPKELAAWMDADARHRERGLELLDRGWIPIWLSSTGRLDDHRGLGDLVSAGLTRGACAEMLVRLLDPNLPDPNLVAEPARLDLSLSEDSRERTLTVTLKSTGRGYVWGEVDLKGAVPGLSLPSKSFDGTPATISILVSPKEMATRPRDPVLLIRVKSLDAHRD